MLGGLVILVIIGAFFISKVVGLLNKRDYYALKELTRILVAGPTLNLYVHYLTASDLAVLLISGFSLQKICQLTDQQPKNSLQQVLGTKVENQLEKGTEIRTVVENEAFISNNLVMLLEAGTTREQIGEKALSLSRTLFYELNLESDGLVVNLQPLCFIFIGVYILGMHLKTLIPMYHLMGTM